jgi:IS5 family transposase
MIGAILGGLSAVASGISAIQNFQQAKQAQKTANMFGQQLQGIKETNALLGLKSPDTSGLQAQQTAAQTAQATQAIQGMGPEGAAQAANIYQAGLQQNAENMQRQAEADFQTDLAKRQNEQQVQFRNVTAQRDLATSRLEGAQQQAADRYNAGIAGVTGAVSGLGNAVAGLATSSQFDYGLDAFKRQQLAKKGYNSEEIGQLIAAGLKG